MWQDCSPRLSRHSPHIIRSFHTIRDYLKHLTNFTLLLNLNDDSLTVLTVRQTTGPQPRIHWVQPEREAVRRQLMVSVGTEKKSPVWSEAGARQWCMLVYSCTPALYWHIPPPPPPPVILRPLTSYVFLDNHISGRSLPPVSHHLHSPRSFPTIIVIISRLLALYLGSTFSEDLTFSVSSVTTWIQRTSVWKSIYF